MSVNDEFGKQPEEMKQPPEIVEYPETTAYAEMAEEPEESKEYPEVSSPSEGAVKVRKKNKKSSKIKRVFKGASAIVASVALVAIIAPGVLASDTPDVTFTSISVSDTQVAYTIDVANKSDETYTAVLYNDFTERVQEITGDSITFVETDLKPYVSYKLAVKSGSDIIAEKSVQTLSYHTEFTISDHACNCEIDGMFQFVMNVVDENEWLSSFTATLTDTAGNVSSCTFSENLNDMQTIPVTGVLVGETATFKITCVLKGGVLEDCHAPFRVARVPQDDGAADREITLYESEVDI